MNRVKSNIKSLANNLDQQVFQIEDNVTGLMEQVAKDGEAWMKMIIMTSGTGWVGEGDRAIAEGRIDTGQMHDDVGSDIKVTFGPSGHIRKIKARAGWGVTADYSPYYLEQNEGFVNPWTDRFVPGMLALEQTFETMVSDYEDGIRHV